MDWHFIAGCTIIAMALLGLGVLQVIGSALRPVGFNPWAQENDMPVSPEFEALVPQIQSLVHAKDTAEAALGPAQARGDQLQTQLDAANQQVANLQQTITDSANAVSAALQDPPA